MGNLRKRQGKWQALPSLMPLLSEVASSWKKHSGRTNDDPWRIGRSHRATEKKENLPPLSGYAGLSLPDCSRTIQTEASGDAPTQQ